VHFIFGILSLKRKMRVLIVGGLRGITPYFYPFRLSATPPGEWPLHKDLFCKTGEFRAFG
jgi:hypothetical protein